MTNRLYRIDGPLGRERMTVKQFADKNAMWAFQNRQSDNAWREPGEHVPLKAGKYAYAGGQWLNVKGLDPYFLAHI